MTPTNFPEANTRFGPPEGIAESQVSTIHAYRGPIPGGSMDGESMVVVAWQPSLDEIAAINGGAPVFISMLGGLAPHFLTTNFREANNPL